MAKIRQDTIPFITMVSPCRKAKAPLLMNIEYINQTKTRYPLYSIFIPRREDTHFLLHLCTESDFLENIVCLSSTNI